MKSVLWMVGGVCAAAIGVILWAPSRVQSVDELAHCLQVAWADNHTSL
jgi:hypothetical protein